MLTEDALVEAFAERGVEGGRPWSPPATGGSLFAHGMYYLGDGNPGIEVCVVPADRRPRKEEARDLWRMRHGKQAAPLLLICPHGSDGQAPALVCGPTEADLAVIEVPFQQAVGLAAGALAEPNGTAAIRFVRDHTPAGKDGFAGLVNQGMFADHTLRDRVRMRVDWDDALQGGREHEGKGDRELIKSLGFTIEDTNTPVSVLRGPGDKARGVAVFLDRGESYQSTGGRFGESSALSLAFTRADRDNIPFVILTRGPEIRLYAAGGAEGVGRKGQAETFVQANTDLLAEDELGFLPLIFGAEALLDGGSFGEILEWSRDYSAALSERLRDRVYIEVVPTLAVAVARHRAVEAGDGEVDLDAVYEETLVILFRLLFLGYAEDRELLPYRSNKDYNAAALKTIARRLANFVNDAKSWQGADTTALWSDVNQLFEAVDKGNRAWAIPSYNGGLFSPDPEISAAGASIATLKVSDEEFAPALTALLAETDAGGVVGPIDFRSLSVRDFGTIYEGLLESSLSVATSDLTLDRRGNYVPARDDDEVEVEAGQIYHHNRSGARKASGSYFTKEFAVEHLLKRALEPALDAHIGRLETLLDRDDEDLAAQAFFDFRCADIAMGSGHFLVAAVDHIERRLALFLDERPIAAVEEELDRLKAAAIKELGDAADDYEIERRALLRRQVARRCVYGVDRNVIAVELARLSIWIHTFVPGVPLSFLDHNLVQGDSLTGIGTIEEAVDYLAEQASGRAARHGQTSVFEQLIHGWLEEAKKPLLRLARASDATRGELEKVREAAEEARKKVEPVRRLFDLVCAMRRGEIQPLTMGVSSDQVLEHPELEDAEEAGNELMAFHLPVGFPEVFLRERPGFDCLIGNPPWEKLQVEEHAFYALHYPGLRALSQARADEEVERLRAQRPDLREEYEGETALIQRMKNTLAAGPYPGLTAGRPDLFKAFSWRFWQLVRQGGRMGIVLPRKALEASGTAAWRKTVLDEGTFRDVTMLTNRGGWVFEDVHQQYTVGLITAVRLDPSEAKEITLRGPFASLAAYVRGIDIPVETLTADDLLSWSDSAAFPLLPDADAMRVFLRMRAHPRLDEPRDEWEPRGLRELNATDDKEHFVFSEADGLWPVYKGESFDLWTPDTGTVYAWADPDHIVEVLQARRANQIRNRRSAFYAMPQEWAADPATLPCMHPRIAWRDTARATDTRTVRAALVPPEAILVHQAYYLFWRQGTSAAEAYALGVLCSTPFDWFARQLVESHVTIEFMRAAPVPRPGDDEPRRRRVVDIAGRLAAVDARYGPWAAQVGVPTGGVAPGDMENLAAELDALVASLYDLDRADIELIFRTFHEGWDYRPALDRTLSQFEAL